VSLYFLVTKHPLRAYDAVQLASAMRVQARALAKIPGLTFLTADDRLKSIAQAEGLSADNPNDHP
jgi:predicted nucleic acid-binding protein